MGYVHRRAACFGRGRLRIKRVCKSGAFLREAPNADLRHPPTTTEKVDHGFHGCTRIRNKYGNFCPIPFFIRNTIRTFLVWRQDSFTLPPRAWRYLLVWPTVAP